MRLTRCVVLGRGAAVHARVRIGRARGASGHPKTLGVKEDIVREAMLDFLAERIFGPDRLRLLRADLARAATATWTEHDADRDRLKAELRDVDRALYRQSLRLEEHDEPDHPVVARATRRRDQLREVTIGRDPENRLTDRERDQLMIGEAAFRTRPTDREHRREHIGCDDR
jgi:hypothetical protein